MNYEQALTKIVLSDDRYVVMTSENHAAIRKIPQLLGKRFIDVGIAEQTLAGAAAGFALRGRTPIIHALASFLTMRSFEFIRTDIGFPNLPVKMVGSVAGFLSEANGPTHQALEDVALMQGIPNMQVFCPADEQDLILSMPALLTSPYPTYIRHNPLQAVVNHCTDLKIGQAEVIAEGSDVTIMSSGMLFQQAFKAQFLLQAKGISTRLVNMRWLKPIDEAEILRAARDTRLIVTLEDHFLTGGLYSIVSEILVRNQLILPVLPLALESRWFKPALLDDVLQQEGFTGAQIVSKISKFYCDR